MMHPPKLPVPTHCLYHVTLSTETGEYVVMFHVLADSVEDAIATARRLDAIVRKGDRPKLIVTEIKLKGIDVVIGDATHETVRRE